MKFPVSRGQLYLPSKPKRDGGASMVTPLMAKVIEGVKFTDGEMEEVAAA